MTYEFKCVNLKCPNRNITLELNLPMHDAGKPQFCTKCSEILQKIFSSPAVKTGDGYKS